MTNLARRSRKMASVDVVIPCYNYGRFIRQCAESVLTQAGVDVRVLVIDDASPDNTAEVTTALARDPRVTVRRHVTNHGHIATYNEGLEWASADYTLLLSADDYLLPGALNRASSLMDANPEVGFTFGTVIELSDDGKAAQLESVIKPTSDSDTRILGGRELIELTSVEGNQVVTCTAIVRTEIQRYLGGYREELHHAGDLEMWLRFAAHAAAGYIFAPQGVYRRHNTSMSAAYYTRSVCDIPSRVSRPVDLYKKGGRLAHLRQKKLAFDFFSERYRDTIPQGDYLCRRLYQGLSASAVSDASAAFNDGEMEESRRLSDLALSVDPEIKRSSAWAKLTCKRWVGGWTWRAVRPMITAISAAQINPTRADR